MSDPRGIKTCSHEALSVFFLLRRDEAASQRFRAIAEERIGAAALLERAATLLECDVPKGNSRHAHALSSPERFCCHREVV